MAIGSKIKISRNKNLVEMKKKTTFKNLARIFNLSESRTKEIYYRELKKIRGTSPLT
jgi:DNA-directed RNA polymerase sigma subunit (sigma70/sigma32)